MIELIISWSVIDQLVKQFKYLNNLVSSIFKAVETELRDCILETAVGLHLHLDPVVGDQFGWLGERLELRFFNLFLDFLDLFLFFEDGRRGW